MNLNELIVLLYEGAGRVDTVQATYLDWFNPKMQGSRVLEQDAKPPVRLIWHEPNRRTSPRTVNRRLWLEAPDQLRLEVETDENVVTAGVRTGGSWWLWTEKDGHSEGMHQSLPTVLRPPLLAPHQTLSMFWLEMLGEGERAGREVVHVRGIPRDQHGAEARKEFEFEFDREYGTMLRRAAFDRNACLNYSEVQTITYGNELEPRIWGRQLVAQQGIAP